MKCQICDENIATVHVQQIMGSEIVELNVCASCAEKRGISGITEKEDLSLSQLLTGLIGGSKGGKGDKTPDKCPSCGKALTDFRKDGKLGCTECYTSFKREIEVFFQNTSGTARHKGKYPERLKAYKSLLIDKELLKERLKEALAEEDYERAATIRDKIRTIEQSSGVHHD